MSKIYVHQMKLRKWFPPRDRFATCVMRLCILREDLFIEMAGVQATQIKKLDGHSVLWRRMYFWRSLVKTVSEFRSTIETLRMLPEFREVLKRQPPSWKKKYELMVKKLSKAQTLLKKTRNSLGGHILQQTVEEALDEMSLDLFSYIEVGRIEKKTHYRFTNEFILEMMLTGVPTDQREAEIEKHFRTVADLLPVFELSGILLTVYAGARNLIE